MRETTRLSLLAALAAGIVLTLQQAVLLTYPHTPGLGPPTSPTPTYPIDTAPTSTPAIPGPWVVGSLDMCCSRRGSGREIDFTALCVPEADYLADPDAPSIDRSRAVTITEQDYDALDVGSPCPLPPVTPDQPATPKS